MFSRRAVGVVLVLVVAALAGAGVVLAQERAPRGRADAPRGRFDRAEIEARMMERMRETLGADEEEWAVLGPRLQEVMTLQRELDAGVGVGRAVVGFRGMGAPRGPERPAEEELSTLQQAAANLRDVLADEDASAAGIRQSLTAYREAREEARQELDEAQTALREALTVRQEARLVMMGLLD